MTREQTHLYELGCCFDFIRLLLAQLGEVLEKTAVRWDGVHLLAQNFDVLVVQNFGDSLNIVKLEVSVTIE